MGDVITFQPKRRSRSLAEFHAYCEWAAKELWTEGNYNPETGEFYKFVTYKKDPHLQQIAELFLRELEIG
ncbi:hypothetical protein [Microbulbifer taiwanensis]|uniref:Uncharacterized protein n=1 Tax=Microbulbifer taiwanensis TaxID=986746 RepID=A0ABW1YIF0_9GAMM|nr:hypothetical protein [Microbulbifer taiwanensis]